MWQPRHKNMDIPAHNQSRITKEVSNIILSRSLIRSIVATIACECFFPRWRPIWPTKHKTMYVLDHIFGATLAAILDIRIPTLLPLREIDSLTLNVLNLAFHLLS